MEYEEKYIKRYGEADQHMHGFIDVIKILDGKITLLTEEEVKGGE